MLGVNRSSDLFAVGDTNPVNQALYLVAGRPGKESCSNVGQANRLLVPTPHVGCFAFSGGREPNRATIAKE